MNYIYIGDIVNTHGIKGEVRLISHFKYKDLVFVKGMSLFVGPSFDKLIINSYRKHKNFDMVTFIGIDNIDDVLKYKGESVYIDRNSISVPWYNEDLIGMSVFGNDKLIGEVIEIINNGIYDILVVKGNKKSLIPNINEFILNIDVSNKRIDINVMEGLINEN